MIRIRLEFTGEHMVEGYQRYLMQSRVRFVWWVLTGVSVVGAIVLMAMGMIAWGAGVLIGFGVGLGLFRVAWQKRRERLMDSPFKGTAVDLEFGDLGLNVSGEDQAMRIGWRNVRKAVRFSDGLMVFVGPRAYVWVNDEEAGGAEAGAGLAEFVKGKVGVFEESG